MSFSILNVHLALHMDSSLGLISTLKNVAASWIAALIQKNPTITDMGVDENNITDDGAKMLADALTHNSTTNS